MKRTATIIRNVNIVTPERCFPGAVCIDSDGMIAKVIDYNAGQNVPEEADRVIDGKGFLLFPGVIDTHVHFREPGMTHKGDIRSESIAAAAGGVTTVFDMPNTNPATTDQQRLEWKITRAAEVSPIHCHFFMGVTPDNADCPEAFDKAAGIKLFLGSTTGNMAVGRSEAAIKAFCMKGHRIVVHCEEDSIISRNLERAIKRFGEDIPFRMHPTIRSRRACIESTRYALDMAVRYGTHLHIAHLSTAEEVAMVAEAKKANPHITAETSPNYLWFDSSKSNPRGENIYDILGARVKCNPSIKLSSDRKALAKGIVDGIIDTIATDHAPHTAQEKEGNYCKAPSGIPSIQHSLQMMLMLCEHTPGLDICRLSYLMAQRPAEIFGLNDRGCIAEGKRADLVLIDPDRYVRIVAAMPQIPEAGLSYSTILSKCGWSPLEGEIVKGKILSVFVDGKEIYTNPEED